MRTWGWGTFCLWALVGTLFGFAWLARLSIGIYILPIAIAATIVVARRDGVWPGILGITEGVAIVVLRIASVDYGISQCASDRMDQAGASASAMSSFTYGGTTTVVERIERCSGIDYRLWLWSGVALALAGLVSFAIANYWRGGRRLRRQASM